MRFFLVFFGVLTPICGVLVYFSSGRLAGRDLPENPPARVGAPVLSPKDVVDPWGASPLRGSILSLRHVVVEESEGGYVHYYLEVGALVREENRPRLKDVLAAVFDPPVGDAPRLRLKLTSPYLDGDPSDLLKSDRTARRRFSLTGGVKATDADGRLLLKVRSLRMLFPEERVETNDPVLLRMPEQGAEVRSRGLFADLPLRELRFPADVVASLPVQGGTAILRTRGPVLGRDPLGDTLHFVIPESVTVEHPWGRVTARYAETDVRGGKAGAARGLEGLERLVLVDRVRLVPAPSTGHGFLGMGADYVVLTPHRARLRGSLHGTWEGTPPRPLFGPGVRKLSIRAGEGEASGELAKREIARARFGGGLSIEDTAGGGHVSARSLQLWRGASKGAWRFSALGEIVADTQQGRMKAVFLTGRFVSQDDFVTHLFRSELFVPLQELGGALGSDAFPGGGKGVLHFHCDGETILRQSRGVRTLRAHDAVAASILSAGTKQMDLACDALRARLGPERNVDFRAAGHAVVHAATGKAHASGDRIDYDGKTAVLTGAPAVFEATAADGIRRHIEARRIEVDPRARTFSATGDVAITLPLTAAANALPWTVRCDSLHGSWDEKNRPVSIDASGHIDARCSDGSFVRGDTFHYDGKAGTAILTGDPAEVRKGKDLGIHSQGFELTFKNSEIVAASTRGKASGFLLPGAMPAGKGGPVPGGGAVKRWEYDLGGPAHFKQGVLEIPAGGTLRAYDEKGGVLLRARAASIEVTTEKADGGLRPENVYGRGGVDVVANRNGKPWTLHADELSYDVAKSRVELRDNGSLEAAGAGGTTRFRSIAFILTRNGIDKPEISGLAHHG